MEKKYIVRIILVILLIVLLVFLINIFREFFILQEIQNNINQYISSTNFHEKITTTDNNLNTTIDIYKKGDNILVITSNSNTESKTLLYYSNTGCDEFYETPESKKAKLNSNGTLIGYLINNYTETDSFWTRFLASVYTKTEEVEIKGKIYYHITGNLKSAFKTTNLDEKEIYIEKDTGLCNKVIYNSGKTENIEYEFNNVTDEIFARPDISQYELIEE